MLKLKCFGFIAIIIGLFTVTTAEGQIPQPARIGGTVTVDGTQLTQATDTGYTFVVTKQNGSAYDPIAEDTDGLNAADWYVIDVPIYDATHQPGGANPGDTAVVHVYKDGSELTVTDPANGEFTVGDQGSLSTMNLVVATIQTYTVTFTAGSGGSLTGSTTQTVNHGGDCTPVKAVPDAGNEFTGWTGDKTGTDNPLTVTNVTADMNIKANFVAVVSGGPADGATLSTNKGNFKSTPTSAYAPAGAPATFPFGLLSFTIEGLAAGATVNVVITMPENISAAAVYYKYQNGQFSQFNNVTGLDDGDPTFTLTITDGGPGDEDGLANGEIVEPGRPAVGAAPPIPTLSEWGMIIFMILFSISAIYMLRRKSYSI